MNYIIILLLILLLPYMVYFNQIIIAKFQLIFKPLQLNPFLFLFTLFTVVFSLSQLVSSLHMHNFTFLTILK